MIQDIFPNTFDNNYKNKNCIRENDYIFYFKENTLLLKQTGDTIELPQKKDIQEKMEEGIFLFTLNNVDCFLVMDVGISDNSNFVYHEIKSLNAITRKEIDYASSVAFQLRNWYVHHKFCGTCGCSTKLKPDERAIICPNCNTTIYPNISPAIIVAILCQDKILLAHNVNFPEGFFSLIAGYVDVGETIEDTIRREAKEEVGLKIKNIKYYKSQPWAFSSSMMLGFIAEVDGDPTITVDGKEIAEAHWYTSDNLPNFPPDRSIAGEIIEKFKAGSLINSLSIIEP